MSKTDTVQTYLDSTYNMWQTQVNVPAYLTLNQEQEHPFKVQTAPYYARISYYAYYAQNYAGIILIESVHLHSVAEEGKLDKQNYLEQCF